jgi:hypothetical protein
MKRIHLFAVAAVAALALVLTPAALAQAPAAPPAPVVQPVDPAADTAASVAAPFVQQEAAKYPVILTILTVIGFARTFAKPVFTVIENQIHPDPTGAALAAAEAGPLWKSIAWALDFLFSVKLHLVSAPAPAK